METGQSGKDLVELLDEAIAECRAHDMQLPFVVILAPAKGGVVVVRATEKRGNVLFKWPAGVVLDTAVQAFIVDAKGNTSQFELSESGKVTFH